MLEETVDHPMETVLMVKKIGSRPLPTAVTGQEKVVISSIAHRYRNWLHMLRVCLLLVGTVGIISACTIPKQMQVDTGLHPKYEDKQVRFRTTYYFRVFDYCADQEGIKVPFAIDSLYRFRMTGKANALTNAVHFESGTLTADEIDPLGANIAFDEKNRQFYFKSKAKVQQEADRERQFKELHQLYAEYNLLQDELQRTLGQQGDDAAKAGFQEFLLELRQAIKEQIIQIRGPQIQMGTNKPDDTSTRPPPEQPAPKTDKQSSQTLAEFCKNPRRGFQILGPEGWRTFNQDERLLLAMSSSGKPLIATLQELSGRILDNQPIEAELLLPILKEDLRITRAERELDRFVDSPQNFLIILQTVINALEEKRQ